MQLQKKKEKQEKRREISKFNSVWEKCLRSKYFKKKKINKITKREQKSSETILFDDGDTIGITKGFDFHGKRSKWGHFAKVVRNGKVAGYI